MVESTVYYSDVERGHLPIHKLTPSTHKRTTHSVRLLNDEISSRVDDSRLSRNLYTGGAY